MSDRSLRMGRGVEGDGDGVRPDVSIIAAAIQRCGISMALATTSVDLSVKLSGEVAIVTFLPSLSIVAVRTLAPHLFYLPLTLCSLLLYRRERGFARCTYVTRAIQNSKW